MVKGQGLWTCSPQQRQSLSVERCLCFKQGWPMRQLVTCNPCDVWPLPPYSPSFCVIGKTPVVWTQNCTSGIIDPPTQTCTFSVQHHAVPNAHMHILRTASRISQRTHAHSPYNITDFPTHTCTFSVQHYGSIVHLNQRTTLCLQDNRHETYKKNSLCSTNVHVNLGLCARGRYTWDDPPNDKYYAPLMNGMPPE
jgi:hypothetical protein